MPSFLSQNNQRIRILASSVLLFSLSCARGEPEFTGDGGSNSRDNRATWHLENPMPQANDLFGVWGISGASSDTDQLYTVGNQGTILVGNTSSWQTPKLTGLKTLRAVSGRTADGEVLAVGDSSAAAILINGQWKVLAPTLGAQPVSLTSVWASSNPDEFFVVGYDVKGRGMIYHVVNQGTSWTPEGGTIDSRNKLFGIWGRGTGSSFEVFAVGDVSGSGPGNGTVLHRDANGTWTLEDSKAPHLLAAVTGFDSPTGDVYAVGIQGTVTHRIGPAMWRNETDTFLSNVSLATTPNFTAVTQVGNSLYISGELGTNNPGAVVISHTTTLLLNWVDITPIDSTLPFTSLWVTQRQGGGLSLYAVGKVGTIFRFQDNAWQSLSQTFDQQNLSSVWASTKDEVYVLDASGRIFRRNSGTSPVTWTQEHVNDTSYVSKSISGFVSPDSKISAETFAAGDNGLILRRQSTSWNTEGGFLTNANLTALWVGPNNIVYVVGETGHVERRTADVGGVSGAWLPDSPKIPDNLGTPVFVDQNLLSVWGDASQSNPVIYIGGQSGLILRRDVSGKYSKEPTTNFTDDVVSIFGTSETNLYALGSRGILLHRQAGTWVVQPSIADPTILVNAQFTSGIQARNTSDLFVLGNSDLLFHLDVGSSTWSIDSTIPTFQTNGQPISLNSFSALDKNEIYVVGAHGLILHHY